MGHPSGPIPNVLVSTSYRQAVLFALSKRLDYEDVDLNEISKMTDPVIIYSFSDSDLRHDLETWKVVVDPDGSRLKPNRTWPTIEYKPDGYWWHFCSNLFAADEFELARNGGLTIALVRAHLGEIRYTLAAAP
jgi:hypothetical protein